MTVELTLAAGLVAYHNILGQWKAFRGFNYIALNLSVATGLLALALGPLEFTTGDLGIGHFSSAWIGFAIGIALCLPLFLALLHPMGRRVLYDSRLENIEPRRIWFRVLVRIPFGTVLLEEVAFRGVLGAASAAHPWPLNLLVPSIAFGLWHVAPAIRGANAAGASKRSRVGRVAFAVAFTTAAGAFLLIVRNETGSLATTMALHATVNALGTIAATRATRPVRP